MKKNTTKFLETLLAAGRAAGSQRNPIGGMSELWQSLRAAIKGSEVCAAALCVL